MKIKVFEAFAGYGSQAMALQRVAEAITKVKAEAKKDFEKQLADIYRKIGESRRKTVKAEQRRVLFGLDQKTKLRVVQCGRDKVSLRSNLRKHGYIIGRASNDAVITAGTRRSEKMERRAETMGIRFQFDFYEYFY